MRTCPSDSGQLSALSSQLELKAQSRWASPNAAARAESFFAQRPMLLGPMPNFILSGV
ncbi:MAG: hypothetical protein F6J93_33910 [Oscillatoria sp. SIO1A7]|nr:hypothetical protein [Oscillatoria sp. SIO1A7]